MTRYRVCLGDDFAVDAVDLGPEINFEAVLWEQTKQNTARARNKLAYLVLTTMVIVLFGAGLMRFVDGDFGALHAVWDVMTVPLGLVLGFYFSREN